MGGAGRGQQSQQPPARRGPRFFFFNQGAALLFLKSLQGRISGREKQAKKKKKQVKKEHIHWEKNRIIHQGLQLVETLLSC